MGYDMSIVQGPAEAELAAKDAVQNRIMPLTEQRDRLERGTGEWKALQEQLTTLREELWSLPDEYYRLNIWGMGWCRDYMLERGMIYETSTPDFPDTAEVLGKYPAPEDFETHERYEAAAYEWDEKYSELHQPTLELHPEGGDTIPSHKFGSNDGWLVTEAECAAAVAKAKASDLPAPTITDEAGLEHPVTWWPSWLDFLERASTRGGFTVD